MTDAVLANTARLLTSWLLSQGLVLEGQAEDLAFLEGARWIG